MGEVFSCALAKSLNISSPECRWVVKGSPQYEAVKACLEAGAAGQIEWEGKVRKTLTFKGLLLSQFVLGTNMDEWTMNHSQINKNGVLSADDLGRKGLRDLGKICALDILCNNSDRLPLLWKNAGNIANVMIQPTKLKHRIKIISIDNSIGDLPEGTHKKDYMDRVATFLQKILQDPVSPCQPEVTRVCEAIATKTF